MSPRAHKASAGPAPAPDEVSRRRLAFIATLYYQNDLDQSETAAIAGVSRSQVSRLLAEARRRGIVRITVEETELRHHALEGEVRRRFGLRHAVVARALGGQEAAQVRRTTGYAAGVISGLIQPGAVVGVAGGRSLGDLVRHMVPLRPSHGARVVQLMGNIGATADEIDAVELARALARRYGGRSWALSAPAFVRDARAREALLAHPHLRQVWDLFAAMEVALVGVGTLDDSAFIERGILDPTELAALRAQGAVGEICGRFFDTQGRECATGYRQRVISIGLDQLRQCREVIAVTNGAHRLEAIQAAVCGGIIKSLVIDEAGAAALLHGPQPGARRSSRPHSRARR